MQGSRQAGRERERAREREREREREKIGKRDTQQERERREETRERERRRKREGRKRNINTGTMSVEFGMHLYGSPPAGVDLANYWTNPKWWFPLGPQPECSVSSNTYSNTRPSRSSGRHSSRLVTAVLGMFHRQQHKPQISKDDAIADSTEYTEVESNKCPACEVANEAVVDDLGMALMALFSENQEAHCDDDGGETMEEGWILDDDGTAGEDVPGGTPADLLLKSVHDDDNADSVDDVIPAKRSRKVKFADDLGLPLADIVQFETSDASDGEEGDEGRQRVKHYFRISKRKRRLEGGPFGTPPMPEAQPTYIRYYKPCMEDYDSCRVQATGVFSMVGF